MIAFIGIMTTGALIAWRRPENPIGWMFCVAGLGAAIAVMAFEYATYTFVTRPGALPGGLVAGLFGSSLWPLVVLQFPLVTLLFPNGRLLSRRWRLVAWGLAGNSAAAVLFVALNPDLEVAPDVLIRNPIGIEGAGDILAGLFVFSWAILAALWLPAAVSLVLRFRRSMGDERQQLKWFTYAAGVMAIMAAIGIPLGLAGIFVSNAPFGLGVFFMAGATGIAILKYRLYDIDLVVNRTLVYVPLTAILAGLYIAVIGVFKTILTERTGAGSDAAVALATLTVVAMLTPLKNYLQSHVDRYFKEARDPARDLEKWIQPARSVTQMLDVGSFTRNFLGYATSALGAQGATVYLQKDGALQPFHACGEPNHAAEVTLPLRCDGTDIGVMTFGSRRGGQPYTRRERQILEESAQVLARLFTLEDRQS